MNLDEFRKAMESDATVENERLKRDLADVEKSYRDMAEGYTNRIQRLYEALAFTAPLGENITVRTGSSRFVLERS